MPDKNTNTNLVNYAVVINDEHLSISLNIPMIRSVLIVQPGEKYPDIPETDFTGGLGIADGDLYYITASIGSEVHIVTSEEKRVIVECTKHGIKEINL